MVAAEEERVKVCYLLKFNMILIVGLGNPGEKYKNTRHNLGFMVVEALREKYQISLPDRVRRAGIDKEVKAEILPMKIAGHQIVLAKPLTFMNASGKAVARLCGRLAINDFSHLWVIHDDVDLPLGKIKIKMGGGAAGHHGVESIIRELGTDKFVRFRLGIGHPGRGVEGLVEKYVLEKFNLQEMGEVKKMIRKTVEAVEMALGEGLTKAMNQFNT